MPSIPSMYRRPSTGRSALALILIVSAGLLATPVAAQAEPGWSGTIDIEASAPSYVESSVHRVFDGVATSVARDEQGRPYAWTQTAEYSTAVHTHIPWPVCNGTDNYDGEGTGTETNIIYFQPAEEPLPFYYAIEAQEATTFSVVNTLVWDPACGPTEPQELISQLCWLPGEPRLAPDRYNQATLAATYTVTPSSPSYPRCGLAQQQGQPTYEVSWQLTRLPDQDCDGIPDGQDPSNNDGPCSTATLEVRKQLAPATDPGRFDLLIDGEVKKQNAGDGGTTGATPVPAGSHTVAEESGIGTSGLATQLNRYETGIGCVDRASGAGVTLGGGPGPVTVPTPAGADVVCTITNTAKQGTLEVRKVLQPAYDAGRFDLLIDGITRKAQAGHGGTTGAVFVEAGDHTVAEESALSAIGEATKLRRYDSDIDCEDETTGETLASVQGPGPTSVAVQTGHAVVCTITNNPVRGSLLLTGAYMYAGSLEGVAASLAGGDAVAVAGSPDALSHVRQVCTVSTWTANIVYRIASTLTILWNGQTLPFENEVTGSLTKTPRNTLTNLATETVSYEACQNGTSAHFGPWPGTSALLAASIQPIRKFSHGLTVKVILDDGRTASVKVPGKSIKAGGIIKWAAQRSQLFDLG